MPDCNDPKIGRRPDSQRDIARAKPCSDDQRFRTATIDPAFELASKIRAGFKGSDQWKDDLTAMGMPRQNKIDPGWGGDDLVRPMRNEYLRARGLPKSIIGALPSPGQQLAAPEDPSFQTAKRERSGGGRIIAKDPYFRPAQSGGDRIRTGAIVIVPEHGEHPEPGFQSLKRGDCLRHRIISTDPIVSNEVSGSDDNVGMEGIDLVDDATNSSRSHIRAVNMQVGEQHESYRASSGRKFGGLYSEPANDWRRHGVRVSERSNRGDPAEDYAKGDDPDANSSGLLQERCEHHLRKDVILTLRPT